jgi:hypothetical protein
MRVCAARSAPARNSKNRNLVGKCLIASQFDISRSGVAETVRAWTSWTSRQIAL